MKKELLQYQLDMLKIEYQKALSQNDRTEIKRLYDDIHNLVKEIEIAKGEEIVQKAKDSGILTKTSQIISLVQLLMCETNNLLSEIEDNFKSAQVMTDSIFLMQKEYYKSADLYFKEFAKIVKQNQMGSGMFSDLEEFDNMIRIFAGLKDMPKPSSLMGGCWGRWKGEIECKYQSLKRKLMQYTSDWNRLETHWKVPLLRNTNRMLKKL